MDDYTPEDEMGGTPEGMTLEDWGREQAAAAGFDPGLPQVQKRITEVADQVRSLAPGQPEAEVIATVGPAITAAIKDGGPGSLSRVQEALSKMQSEFSPEKEAAVRKQVRGNKTWDAATQNLSLYGRMVATPEQSRVFQQMDAQQAERSNEPMENWQAKKKAAMEGIAQEIKMGEVSRAEVQGKVSQLMYDQAIAERASKEKLAAAEADPASVTSEAMRALVKKRAPQLVEQIGANFERMTAAQLKGYLPTIEKEYLKFLDEEKAKLDRASREAVAGSTNASRERTAAANRASADARAAANRASADARAAAGRAAKTDGPVIKPDKALSLINAIEKGDTTDKGTLASIKRSQELLKEAETLISGPNGVSTGPVVGALFDTGLGKMLAGPERQRLDQITGDLANQLLMAAKGAQTEGDAQRMRAIVDMLKQRNPGPGIKAAKEALTRSEAVYSEAAAERQRKVDEVRQLGGLPTSGGAASKPTVSGW